MCVLLLILVASGGCSVRNMAMNQVADSLSAAQGGAFGTDPDLRFIGEATPFALKLMESIAAGAPRHADIRTSLAAGFVQYATAFVAWPAEQRRFDDDATYRSGLQRAREFDLRANAHAAAALEIRRPGLVAALLAQRADALDITTREDLPALFWLAASWLSALATGGVEDPVLIGRLPLVERLLRRCESLDPDWKNGALAEAMIGIEPNLPGPDKSTRARRQFDRTLALGGERAGPYVALAFATALPEQDRAGFAALLRRALAIGPGSRAIEDRPAELYARERAHFYLQHLDDLFITGE